jgi:hypothetical protein
LLTPLDLPDRVPLVRTVAQVDDQLVLRPPLDHPKVAMYPSSLRIFAIATRILVDGIVVSVCRAMPAFRIRVSMSLIGSFTLIRCPSVSVV